MRVRTIAGCLALLLISTLSATAIAFAGVLWSISAYESARLQSQAQATANDMRASLDRELDGLIGLLQALATSPALQSGDLFGFYKQAISVLHQRGNAIAVRRPDGQQLLNTIVPWGTPLPISADPVLRKADLEAVRTRQPRISNLYVGAVAKRLFVLVVVPAVIDDQVKYLVNIAVEPAQLKELISRRMQSEWTASIVDGNYRVIARSRQHERFVGEAATQFVREYATGDEGTWSAMTLEGTKALASYSKSQLSDWRVIVGIPTAELSQPFYRSMTGFGSGAVLALLLSGMLATYYGKTIRDAVKHLESVSLQVGELGPMKLKPTGLAEVDAVGHVLESSSARLSELLGKLKAEQTAAAELARRFAAAEEAAGGFIFQRDLVSGFVWHSEGFSQLLGYRAGDYEPTYEAWCGLVHPDDEPRFRGATQADAVVQTSGFHGEYRVRRKDGQYLWLRVRARADGDSGGAILIGSAVDVTREREAAEHRELLLHELAHRGKNMLAMIQSVAKYSLGKKHPDVSSTFTDRIQTIGATYSALLKLEWRGILLSQLVEIGAMSCKQIQKSGPEIWVEAKAAQTLALMFHELACNMRVHHAATEAQHAQLTWEVMENEKFRLVWREVGNVSHDRIGEQGFGSFLLTAVVSIEFQATPVYHVDQEGVRYELITDLSKVGHVHVPSPKASNTEDEAMMSESKSSGNRILLVEDEPLIGLDAKATLEELGYQVEGPIMSLGSALEAAGQGNWNAALLDVNLSGDKVWPVARVLIERQVKIAFLTGYASLAGFPEDLVSVPRIDKPVQKSAIQKLFPPVAGLG